MIQREPRKRKRYPKKMVKMVRDTNEFGIFPKSFKRKKKENENANHVIPSRNDTIVMASQSYAVVALYMCSHCRGLMVSLSVVVVAIVVVVVVSHWIAFDRYTCLCHVFPTAVLALPLILPIPFSTTPLVSASPFVLVLKLSTPPLTTTPFPFRCRERQPSTNP